jgi:hypothetical protein
VKDLEPGLPLFRPGEGALPLPGHGAAALGAFYIKTGRPLLVGLPVPTGRADAKSAGAGAEPTAAATATPTSTAGAATLAASWTSLLCKNCHLNSSLAAETFDLPFKRN